MRKNKQVSSLLKGVTDALSRHSSEKNEAYEPGVLQSEDDRASKSLNSSSGFRTPNFFDSVSTPRRCLLSEFEKEVEAKLCENSEIEARSPATSSRPAAKKFDNNGPSKEVRAFIDVSGSFDKQSLKKSLEELGATVCSSFGKDVTHLIFWNGLQDVLDKAHQKGYSPLIVAPHWVEKYLLIFFGYLF